ncbi:hypothetical protein ACA910_019923 [Epithemia clementina (nom. ined.)]
MGRKRSSSDTDSQTKASSKYTVGPEFRDELEQYREGLDERNDEPSKCSSRRICVYMSIVLCLLLSAAIGTLAYLYLKDDNDPKPLASCGGCHCIPGGEAAECPTEKLESGYSNDFIDGLKNQKALNAVEMPDCDPYVDYTCSLGSPLGDYGSSSVCGIHYEESSCSSYKLQTYADKDLATGQGAFVTHLGACGVCSTTQDLAAFMKQMDMITASENCEVKASAGQSSGRECFEALGFSSPCADLWANAARNNEKNCAFKCVVQDLQDTPFNGDSPTCSMNECLQCMEYNSAKTFQQFAGRTHASSGILSAVVRLCSDFANIQQQICPSTEPLLN